MSDFPFVNLPGPQSSGRKYGPGKLTVYADWFVNRNGAAVAVGDVLQVDAQNTDTTATEYGLGRTNIFAGVLAPRAAFITGEENGFIAVVLTAAANDADVFCCWHGDCDAFVIASTGSPILGAPLVVDTNKNFDFVQAATERFFGMCLGAPADSTPTTRSIGPVLVEYRGVLGQAFIS